MRELIRQVLREGIMFGKSEESKRNEKIAAILNQKLGGEHPYIDIIDKMSFHNRVVLELMSLDATPDVWDDDDPEEEEADQAIQQQNYDAAMDKYLAPYKNNTYHLKIEYRDGQFLVIWTTPVGHPGGKTVKNLTDKLEQLFKFYAVTDYTLRCVSKDGSIHGKGRSHSYDYYINGDETFVPFKQEEKKRKPYNPDVRIDPDNSHHVSNY